MLKIVIIGRPNVGKSTLFNRLCKKRIAIVHDYSGVTRDVKEYKIKINDTDYILYDTAGLEDDKNSDNPLSKSMTNKSLRVIKDADIVLFVVDLTNSLNPVDDIFSKILKKECNNVLVLANKADVKSSIHNISDLYRFGFTEILPISSEHGIGISKLHDTIVQISNEILSKKTGQSEIDLIDKIDSDDAIYISIVGRPNVGKSTLINALIHEDKLLVSDIAGTTRDSIDSPIVYNDKNIIITDTAGVRRKTKIDLSLETLSVKQTFASLRRSDISILVLDGNNTVDKQDIVLIDYANSVGNAIIIFVNKTDILQNITQIKKDVTDKIYSSFNQIKAIPIILGSAIKKQGLKKLLDEIINTSEKLNLNFSTGQLNKWLQTAIINNPPPLSRLKRPMKFKYITQTGINPHEFTIFVGGATNAPDSYKRYLVNSLRENFNLGGIPIRILLKKSDNPYST